MREASEIGAIAEGSGDTLSAAAMHDQKAGTATITTRASARSIRTDMSNAPTSGASAVSFGRSCPGTLWDETGKSEGA